MGYLHVEIESSQTPKYKGAPCGDMFEVHRMAGSTLIILSDGLGSGIKANIAATMCIARLKELIRSGVTLRKAFAAVVDTMNHAARNDLPYAVFTVARILTQGQAVILNYEMPPAVYISNRSSEVLPRRTYTVEGSVVGESTCELNPREALLLVSDGVTQAGLGITHDLGWGIDNVNKFINSELENHRSVQDIPYSVHAKAMQYNRNYPGDDTTAVLAYSRLGSSVNILSGTPKNKETDEKIVNFFLARQGIKIICGGSTANVVSRITGKSLVIDESSATNITPPSFSMNGIDLVTEGAMTLNQLYNVIDEPRGEMDEDNPVTKLYDLIMLADRVNFYVGTNVNPASMNIKTTQLGIISREKIIPLLAGKLEKHGKFVNIKKF
ncbi:MAG: SpoIIE family protein phosphatase [Candidatus Kapaibacterium sp.]